MQKKTAVRLRWRQTPLFIMALALLFFATAAHAKNPDVSSWMHNLSESAAADEPGYFDDAPEVVVVGNTVHVMWRTSAEDEEGKRLYQFNYRRSLDNGVSWEPKVTVYTTYDHNIDLDETKQSPTISRWVWKRGLKVQQYRRSRFIRYQIYH